MRLATVQPIIDELFDHLDRGRSWRTNSMSIPATHYTESDQARVEDERLFRSRPQVVALTPDLPRPGTYLTRDRFPVPLLLARGDDGVVRGFANVCAHRAAQVVADGRGAARRVACPYHAWTYGLDGTLVGVPDRDAFDGLCVPGPGLAPVEVAEAHGVIWASPGPAPAPDLGPIADDLDSFDVARHRHWRHHRFELDLNWKLVIDTFLEGYHFASLHRDTVGPLFLPNLCVAHRFGPHVREVLPRRTLDELRDQPRDTWDIVPHSALVYVLFPNTVFVMQIDHLETWRVTPDPDDPTRSVTDLDFYVPDEPATDSSERHWQRNWDLTIDTVINEDFAAMAGVQRGLASGVLDEVRIGANEPALGLFHQALADALDG